METSLADPLDEVVTQAVHYIGKHREGRLRGPLPGLLKSEAMDARWTAIWALGELGGREAEEALICLLTPIGWVARGEGRSRPSGMQPFWWLDCRNSVVEALSRMQSRHATPALLAVLREKGSGVAYHGESILPYLRDYGTGEALPELRRIVDTDPRKIAPTVGGSERVKAKAHEAITAIIIRSI